MIIDFVGASRQDSDNIAASPSRLINLYREQVGDRFVLKGVPGQVLFSDIDDVLGRAVGEVGGNLYAVTGSALYSVGMGGLASNLGAVADDVDTFISGYASNVLISAGGNYYVYDGGSLSTITGGAFSDIGSVAFVGGYAVLTERNGSRFQWSDLQDPTTLNPLYFATAEGVDDILLRAMELNGNLYLFGTETTEVWYNAGGSGATAFIRAAGGLINKGLLSAGLVTSFGDGMFMVANDGIVYLFSGSGLSPVSTAGVETAIAEETPTRCFYYEDEGHKFMVLRFANRPAWVFDVRTGEWHERATGLGIDAWDVVDAVKAYGGWKAIDINAQVVSLTGETDLDQTIIKRAVSKTFEGGGERFRASRIIARARSGFHSLGRDMNLIARFSGDRGVTWGPQKSRSLGDTGEYSGRAVWRSQGLFRTLTMELTLGDSTDAPIYSDVVLDVI